MLIVGLTGSIGMGKSTVADMFRDLGVPVYDADAAVHRIYGPGGSAVRPIGEAFPEAVKDGKVDRNRLSAAVVGDRAAMARLEAIVHPLLTEDRRAFLARAAADGASLVLMDIPLLFETGGEDRVDVVVVVSAPPAVQRERVLSRPGMTPAKFAGIVDRQMSDSDKRRRADFVVRTDRPLAETRREVRALIRRLKRRKGKIWRRQQSDAPAT